MRSSEGFAHVVPLALVAVLPRMVRFPPASSVRRLKPPPPGGVRTTLNRSVVYVSARFHVGKVLLYPGAVLRLAKRSTSVVVAKRVPRSPVLRVPPATVRLPPLSSVSSVAKVVDPAGVRRNATLSP